MLPSTGTVGDSYDNAMAESVNGAYKTELVWRRKHSRPGRARIGDVPVGLVVELEASPPVTGLQDTGTDRNRVSCKPSGTSRLTIKGEQKSGHFRQPHRARHAPLRRTRHTPTTTKNLTHENSRSPSTLQFHYKGHITAYARRRAYACTTPATSRTRR